MAIDLSTQTPPTPRAATPGTSGRQNPRTPSAAKAQAAKTTERAEGVHGLFQLTGAGLLMFGQVADAGACAQHGENISNEVAALAETNEPIAKAVDFITGVGPYAALIAAVLPFGLQILLNHGRIPNAPILAQFGVVPPQLMQQRAALEAEAQQAAMMQQFAEQQEAAQRKQREAQERMAATAA